MIEFLFGLWVGNRLAGDGGRSKWRRLGDALLAKGYTREQLDFVERTEGAAGLRRLYGELTVEEKRAQGIDPGDFDGPVGAQSWVGWQAPWGSQS